MGTGEILSTIISLVDRFAISCLVFLSFVLLSTCVTACAANRIEVNQNQLYVDGVVQPQLFGAELQYFRLRGGYGRNVPRQKVIDAWNRALDHMVEAKMNAISFYIPWDFHEYAEGKFDFTGSVDEDGDGNPDYPSRDIFTFFKLIEQHGIHRIMVRPGPYINAEWGFLGFGAIPLWFHQKYTDSHMRNSAGLKTKLYDYHNPDLLRHTQLWFKELHHQVLSRFMGPGKPILFVQIDNETNFMWQSIYNHDYGGRAMERYREFVKAKYRSIESLNAAQNANFPSWSEVIPPTIPGKNLTQDRDWYEFQDESIHAYLKLIRNLWEDLGVSEPRVMFTLAESYNAMEHGLLPNFQYRNDPGHTGLMTVNLYPKTYESPNHSLLNLPFKSDHDVKAVSRANDHYYGSRQEWSLGPEIQGGWWKGTDVTDKARKQTYLSTIGHGLKALFVYYFSEGYQWQGEWAKQQIEPLYNELKRREGVETLSAQALSSSFWSKLQKLVENEFLVGIDVKSTLLQAEQQQRELYFDAPLDKDANPTSHFALLKEVGAMVASHGDFLSQATELTDSVALIKNVNDHPPSSVPGVDSVKMNSDWSGGLLGYLLQAGINPTFHHWNLNPKSDLEKNRLLFYQDAGFATSDLISSLNQQIREGSTVVSFLGNSLAKGLGVSFARSSLKKSEPAIVQFGGESFSVPRTPFSTYTLGSGSLGESCHSLLKHGEKVAGYYCQLGKGYFVQIGALIYDVFNSDNYSELQDVRSRRHVLEWLLKLTKLTPQIKILEGGDRVVAFARKIADQPGLWLTVKSARAESVTVHIEVPEGRIIKVDLPSYGSTALFMP